MTGGRISSTMTVDPITEQLPVTTFSSLTGGARGGAGSGTPQVAAIALAGVAAAGLTTLVAGAWAGIVPFVGPKLGFAPAGAAAWHWRLVDAVLNAVPGGVAVAGALVMLVALLRVRRGAGRVLLVVAGGAAVAAGAWMVLGTWALPLVSTIRPAPRVLTPADFWRLLGYHLGPGMVLVGSGVAAAVLGNRHRTVRLVYVGPSSP
jgi:hypothetical protein